MFWAVSFAAVAPLDAAWVASEVVEAARRCSRSRDCRRAIRGRSGEAISAARCAMRRVMGSTAQWIPSTRASCSCALSVLPSFSQHGPLPEDLPQTTKFQPWLGNHRSTYALPSTILPAQAAQWIHTDCCRARRNCPRAEYPENLTAHHPAASKRGHSLSLGTT